MQELLENPLYMTLVCGSLTLILVAVCAALAVVSRHAASYYTHEDKRNTSATATTTAETSETEGLCSPTAVYLAADQQVQIKKKKKKKEKKDAATQLHNTRNNNSKIKNVPGSPARVHSRGVHCGTNGRSGVAVYPLSSSDGQDQRPLC